MQLGSSGIVRPVLGRATNKILARSIHIPLPRPRVPAPSAAHRVVQTTRTLVSRFFAHLATPGTLRAPVPAGSARGLQHLATRTPGISHGLSLPARHALSRPFGAPHLPRASAVPRSVTQVGLGCARNFHSARPVFQSLADNVPVGVRALMEADLDVHGFKGPGKTLPKMMKAEKKAKGKQALKENASSRPSPLAAKKAKKEANTTEEEMNHYFPAAAVSAVTTHVLIPLAPAAMSSERRPLRDRSVEHLPMASLGNIHISYGTHSLRVSSLFGRLDRANVFDDPSVRCTGDALGTSDGECRYVRMTFEGWTADRVLALLGDAGKGWCEIEEEGEDDSDSILDDTRSDGGSSVPWDGSLSMQASIDPAQSFILPTLDFSQSEGHPDMSMSHLSWPTSPAGEPSDTDDVISNMSLSDDEDGAVQTVYGLGPAAVAPSASSSTSASWVGLGFSSQFADAMNVRSPTMDGPMEYMF
jgi:hypothetical protein